MLKIIVFIFGSAGFSWLRGLFPLVVVSGGRSLVVLRLQGTQASAVVVHGLSCSSACGIFLNQGLNLHLLHWQVDSYPLRHQGSLSVIF